MAISPLNRGVKNKLIREIVEEDYRTTPEKIYPLLVSEYFPNQSPHKIDARLTIALCDAIDEEENSADKHPLKKAVESALSDYNFAEIGDQEKSILSAFEAAIIDKNSGDKIFESSIQREDEELVEELLKNYTVELYERYLLIDSKKAEEMRATLAQLIRDGELNLPNLHSEVIEKKMEDIKADLRNADRAYSGYFLFDHRLFTKSKMDNRSRLYERNPLVIRVSGSQKYGEKHSGDGLKPVLHMVFTEDNYASAMDFLQNEIIPLLPPKEEWETHSMVAALPFETGDWEVIPEEDKLMQKDWKKTYEENIEDFETMAGRSESIASSLTVDWVVSKADVDELLQVLPLNVFIPEHSRDVRNVVRKKENYRELKKSFEIESLFDWASVNGEDLGKELADLDNEEVLAKDEWKNVGSEIVDSAKKTANATLGDNSF